MNALVDVPAGAAVERRSRRCGNCRAVLAGPYCARCGQRDVDLNVTTRALLLEGVQELADIDRRFFRTLRLLFLRPGHLTRVYLHGRRARYTSPLRLYLVASVLFFSAYLLTQGVREGYLEARSPQVMQAARQIEPSGAAADRPLPDRLRDLRPALAEGQRRAIVDRRAFLREYSENLSWALLCALPVFSLILALVHLRSGRVLLQHLVFSLHFGAAFLCGFLALMMAGVLAKTALAVLGIPPAQLPDVNLLVYLPGGVALLAYLYLAMRRVYRERSLVGAVRFALTATLFAGSLFLTFTAAVLYTLLTLG